MRIFLDANVLFAASWSDGAVRQLLQELLADGHELIVNAYVIEEARRNLSVKSRGGVRQLDRLMPRLEVGPVVLDLPSTITALPEKDRPVLASAVRASCQALVTGDRRHFGRLYGRTIDGVAIHSPASLAEELLL